MKCDLSLFTILVTTLFTLLPIGVGCCSYDTLEIISLISRDPDFQQNPCYIQWKAEQDAKREQLWKRRDELMATIARNDEIERENRRREQESRRNMYSSNSKRSIDTSSTIVKKKENPIGTLLGLIFFVFFVICCCAWCCSCVKSDNDSNALPTATTPRNNLNPAESTTVSIAPLVNQTTSNANANDNIVIGTERSPFSRDSNLPLYRGVINRQNSLPTYDDAVRMPSALPKE